MGQSLSAFVPCVPQQRNAPAARRAPTTPSSGTSGRQTARGPKVSPSALEFRSSVESLVSGDKYRTTGPVTTSNPGLGVKPREFQQFELTINKGRAYQGDRLLDGEEIKYVMDGLGNIYTDMDRALRYHSNFFSDGRVAASGEIAATAGHITAINNKSGHYKLTIRHTDQVVQELASRGIKVSRIQRDEIDKPEPRARYYREADDDSFFRKYKNY
jgi:hypothetical protein